MTDLPLLISTLEQAGEGSRELDLAVAQTLGRPWSHTDNPPTEPGGEWWPSNIKCGAYTTSIDAALALIGKQLPGWCASVVIPSPEPCEGYVWERGHRDGAQGKGETGAIALCLALCRALQAQGETHDA